jgi:hypothetical protein
MAELLIAFDLASPQQHKSALIDCLMRLGEGWARPLETVWVLRTDRSAADIEAALSQCLGPDDGLLVQPISERAALVNASLRWFRRRLDIGAPEAPSVTAECDHRPSGRETNIVTLRVVPSPWLQLGRSGAIRAAS